MEAVSGQKIGRLVTVAYMAMLRISTKLRKLMESHKTRWVPVDNLPELAFDHRDIIDLALERVRSSVKKEPALIYDMLPAKFTALQLRRLNEEIHGKPMDVRNFHKKIASRPYIVPLDEKEEGFPTAPRAITVLTVKFIIVFIAGADGSGPFWLIFSVFSGLFPPCLRGEGLLV